MFSAWTGPAPATTLRTSQNCTPLLSVQRLSPTSPPSLSCAPSSATLHPPSRTPAQYTAPSSALKRSPQPRNCSASTPPRASSSRRTSWHTPASLSSAARLHIRHGTKSSRHGLRLTPSAPNCTSASSQANCPQTTRLPSLCSRLAPPWQPARHPAPSSTLSLTPSPNCGAAPLTSPDRT